jgi:hypothetical protein
MFKRSLIVGVFCAVTSLSGLYARAALISEIQTFPATGNAVQMQFSPQYHLLFLRNSASAIRVVDTNSQSEIDLHLATESFSDMDLTPDGRYLYAADFGGEQTGYGTPIRPSWVHRYDLAARTWQAYVAPRIAYRLEAVDSSRFLLLESDQWVDVTLNRWQSGSISELARRGTDYYGDIAYDSHTERFIHGNSGSSSQEIHAYHLIGDTIGAQESTGTYGSAQGYGGTYVLSSDGSRYYYGRLQVESLDVQNNLRVFPESIYAASPLLAFGRAAYYNAATGANLGTLGLNTSTYTVCDDGTQLWAFQQSGNILHHYVLLPEPTTSLLLIAGLMSVSKLRRRRAVSQGA